MYKYDGKLNNEALRYIDPENVTDDETKLAIIEECKNNAAYFTDVVLKVHGSSSILIKMFLLSNRYKKGDKINVNSESQE